MVELPRSIRAKRSSVAFGSSSGTVGMRQSIASARVSLSYGWRANLPW